MRDLTRGEHLAGSRLAAESRREVQRAASVPGLDGHGLAGVQADPDRQEQVGIGDRLGNEALLEVERGADRLARRSEDRKRLVAAELDQRSAAMLDAFARDARELRGELRSGLVPSFLGEQRVATDVGDQERLDRGAGAVVARRSARVVLRLFSHRPSGVSPTGGVGR